MRRLVAAAAIAALPAQAMAHGPYADWKQPGSGISCCSDRDCKPVELCDHGRGLALEGACVPIPWDKVIAEPSPDGRDHACYSASGYGIRPTILCVVLGGQT